ncbi:MAG: hypothetical protein ACOY94_24860 [Bacillota bacterium]
MRLNDRMIREGLRKQAMSVPVPEDMWANISRELDKDAAKAGPSVQARRSGPGFQVRQMLAVGAAAGIFWMMVIPSGAYVDRVQKPAPKPSATAVAQAATGEPPWDIPTEEQIKRKPTPAYRPGPEMRRPAAENFIIR